MHILLWLSTNWIAVLVWVSWVILSIMFVNLLFNQRSVAFRLNMAAFCILVAILMAIGPGRDSFWQWLVALTPAVLVGHQWLYLWLFKPTRLADTQGTQAGHVVADGDWHSRSYQEKREPIFQKGSPEEEVGRFINSPMSERRALEAINNHFGAMTLLVRYGVPASLLAVSGVVLVKVCAEPTIWFAIKGLDPTGSVGKGVLFGVIGAFTYVLLELSRRLFRHDITSASAMGCFVVLVLGPILAGLLGRLFKADVSGQSSIGWEVVLFYAGYAPKRIITALEQTASQLLKLEKSAIPIARITPLSSIQGISPEYEARLAEEGIIDIIGLASAEPIRLVRNTSFDLRLILSWMDEALLIRSFPRAWNTLEELGISGAIDLAWLSMQCSLQLGNQANGPGGNSSVGEKQFNSCEALEALSTKCGIDKNVFQLTSRALSEDSQVLYVWTLYQQYTEYTGWEPIVIPKEVDAKG